MTQNAGETKTKNGGKKDKEYLIEWIQKTCIIQYKGSAKDRVILKFVPFINTFGGTAVQITAWSSIIIGFFGISVIPEYLTENLYIFLPGIALSFCICVIGIHLFSYAKYVRDTRCKKCCKNYAYVEIENPDIREVSTEELYKVTITRYWKCRYCGYIDRTESPEDLVTRKGKMKKPKRVLCEKCGKSRIYPEYKKPDIKSDGSVFIEIRYYICEYCKYVNIEVEKTLSGEGSSSESKGSDPRF